MSTVSVLKRPHGCKRNISEQLPEYKVPNKLLRYCAVREIGGNRGVTQPLGRRLASQYVARQLPGLLKETEYDLGAINKVFASHWISDRDVVIGTKCNKLLALNLDTSQLVTIPTLKSSTSSVPAECPTGIHSIAVNPSQTLLATGASNTNDLALYSIPTFDPIGTGEEGHTDWIFDIKWLDDQFIFTGSRDGHVALWRVKDHLDVYHDVKPVVRPLNEIPPVSKNNITMVTRKASKTSQDKVRALAYYKTGQEVAALSLNAHIQIWDVAAMRQKTNKKLNQPRENVCITVSDDLHLYAIGSQSQVTLMDTRTFKSTTGIPSKHRGCGIRSVSFNQDVVTFGTGSGALFFYDVRANKYLEMKCGHETYHKVGKGWLKHDETYEYFFFDQQYPNAVYTHSYDITGTKLFCAGGPLPAGLWGNYAALWQ